MFENIVVIIAAVFIAPVGLFWFIRRELRMNAFIRRRTEILNKRFKEASDFARRYRTAPPPPYCRDEYGNPVPYNAWHR